MRKDRNRKGTSTSLKRGKFNLKKKEYDKVIVTQHPSLVQLIHELGLARKDTLVLERATVQDIRGKHVIGILPLSLAIHARKVTRLVIKLPYGVTERDAPYSLVKACFESIMTYQVVRTSFYDR